jgi:hypothetical protein
MKIFYAGNILKIIDKIACDVWSMSNYCNCEEFVLEFGSSDTNLLNVEP